MKLKLKEMTGEAAKEILQGLLKELSGIDVSDMTTFELNVIRKSADNPPKLPAHGVEQ